MPIRATNRRPAHRVVTASTSPGPRLSYGNHLHLVSYTTNANDTVCLPVSDKDDIGKQIHVYAVTGFEVIAAEAGATCNNVTIGATNELAIVAGTYVTFTCVANNKWLTTTSTLIDGTQTKLVPDALA
jgi:hypothetical protein